MTRVYISGPITGAPNLNREAFDKEEQLQREAGHEVFNPHSLPAPSDEERLEWIAVLGMDRSAEKLWQYYMKLCIVQIPLCDEMRMLPNWQNSKGAVWEHRIAMMLGLKVSYCPVGSYAQFS